MKIKKGDNVRVIAGKDKGKTGVVIAAMPVVDRVVVEGINIVVRHKKTQSKEQIGGRIKKEASIHVSNVVLAKEPAKKAASKPEAKAKDNSKTKKK